MKHSLRWSLFVPLAFVAVVAACSGTPNTPFGSVVGGGNPATAPPGTALVNAKLVVSVPQGSDKGGKRSRFVSTSMQSLVISLASANGKPVNNTNATIVDTFAKAPGCTSSSRGLSCTATVPAAPGTDAFNVSTFSAPGGTGSILSVGTLHAQIGTKNGFIAFNSATAGKVQGIIAQLKIAVSPSSLARGKAVESAVNISAYDDGGALIGGESDYAAPVTLTIQGDVGNAFLLHGGGAPATSIAVAKPSQHVTLVYDGNAQATSVTLQAGVQGYSSISAQSDVSLRGTPAPPPAGEIFALNAGTGYGYGATVTVYDGKANGNAKPKRTLQLSSTLYARSIAVDANGNLYVGYMDTIFGANPQSGLPDTGNEIAIYAPGASGAASPSGVIAYAASSSTAVFPSSLALDAQGDLVVYGSSANGSNTVTSVNVYPAGSKGAAKPSHAWAFVAPLLRYPGVLGLTLDSSNNAYVNGKLSNPAGGFDYGLYTNPAAQEDDFYSSPARTIPWGSPKPGATPLLTPNLVSNVALDASGEIYIGNVLENGGACQGQASVFAGGATGGTTAAPPLRVLKLQGVATTNPLCSSSRNKLNGYYPFIEIFGNSIFVADQFDNAIDAFPALGGGTVKASQAISGAATGLNNPIGVVVTQSTTAEAPR